MCVKTWLHPALQNSLEQTAGAFAEMADMMILLNSILWIELTWRKERKASRSQLREDTEETTHCWRGCCTGFQEEEDEDRFDWIEIQQQIESLFGCSLWLCLSRSLLAKALWSSRLQIDYCPEPALGFSGHWRNSSLAGMQYYSLAFRIRTIIPSVY